MLGFAVRLLRHCEISPDSDSTFGGWVAGAVRLLQVDLLSSTQA